jgi:hypothetical protein
MKSAATVNNDHLRVARLLHELCRPAECLPGHVASALGAQLWAINFLYLPG